METRIAITPSDGAVVDTQILNRLLSGPLYLLRSHDPGTGCSTFEIRGVSPSDEALKTLQTRLGWRAKFFEIFTVEAPAVTKYVAEAEAEVEAEDVDEFEDEFSDQIEEPVLLEDAYGTEDPAEWQVVART